MNLDDITNFQEINSKSYQVESLGDSNQGKKQLVFASK